MRIELLYVFLGGGLGSVARYSISQWLDAKSSFGFPLGTFVSNMTASLIIGLLAGYMLQKQMHDHLSLFLLVGFCGGFSTFSTFSKDNYFLLEDGLFLQLFLNIFFSLLLGIGFFFIGLMLTKQGS